MGRIIGQKNTTKESMERYIYTHTHIYLHTYIYFNMTKEFMGITENKSKHAVVRLNSNNIITVYKWMPLFKNRLKGGNSIDRTVNSN